MSKSVGAGYRLAVDIGGTFTDVVLEILGMKVQRHQDWKKCGKVFVDQNTAIVRIDVYHVVVFHR